jgi:DNA-directed RNA polymerase specialized sigma24 family protein
MTKNPNEAPAARGIERWTDAGATPVWALLRDCTEGPGEEAWRELVLRCGPSLTAAVRRLLRRAAGDADPAAVEDLVQEVYCRLLASWRRPSRRFRGSCDAEAAVFLRRVAASVVLDRRREACAGKRGGGRQAAPLGELVQSVPAPAAAQPDAELRDREARREFLLRCRAVLGRRASRSTLRVVELALLDGLSTREIVARFPSGPKASGVNSVIFRLRRRFAREGVAVPRRKRRAA